MIEVKIHTLSGIISKKTESISEMGKWLNNRYEKDIEIKTVDDIVNFMQKVQPFEVDITTD